MGKDNGKVIDTSKAIDVEAIPTETIPTETIPTEAPAPPENDPKIIVMQLVTPTYCNFICLSTNEENSKFEVGIMKK